MPRRTKEQREQDEARKQFELEREEMDAMFKGFDPMPPFNVAKMVDHLITEHGERAADWAQTMARWARSIKKQDIAEDYEMVARTILKRQGKI